MKTGVVYLKIRVELNQDMKEDDIPEFVDNLEYEIKDNKGRVANTEIIDSDTSVAF